MATPTRNPGTEAVQRPVALLYGPGHVVVHGNPPFLARFGRGCLGLPAAEALVALPGAAFELMDLVYREARPLACRLIIDGEPVRVTAVPKRDVETGEIYGIAIRFVPEVEPPA
jgi:hypothetical protein